MQYNTTGEQLKLREYGRSVQNMVTLLLAEPDREKRTRLAHVTIRTMSIVVPESREMENYEQKLWEQLQQLCDYRLDVDAPFPLPTEPPTNAATDPGKKVHYYPHRARFRQFGKNVELMIARALAMEEGEEKKAYVENLANYMKHSMQVYAGAQPTDKVVLEYLRDLSGGALALDYEQTQLRSGLLPNRLNLSNASNISHVKKSKKKISKTQAANKKKRKRPMR